MNPEALKHRKNVKQAKLAHAVGKLTQEELYQVVDEYRAFMKSRVGKNFSRNYILRNL